MNNLTAILWTLGVLLALIASYFVIWIIVALTVGYILFQVIKFFNEPDLHGDQSR